MPSTYSYACRDYPGMEACPARFTAATEHEVLKLVELHASIAHGEDPASWSDNDRSYLRALIKPD